MKTYTDLLASGKSFYQDNNIEEALRCFNEAITINPYHGTAYLMKGLCII